MLGVVPFPHGIMQERRLGVTRHGHRLHFVALW